MFKKIIKIYFAFIAVFIASCFYSFLPVQAGELLDINFFGYDPLFEEANFVPGESVSRFVEVENISSEQQAIVVKADNSFDDGLGKQMEINIFENTNLLYKSSMTNFLNEVDEVFLSNVSPDKSALYNFVITFFKSTDNTFQGANLNFDIRIGSQAQESIGGENGSSSGGYQYSNLLIFNESVVVNNTSATIAWSTNKPATSRVIYDILSHPDISISSPPNYYYKFSSIEDVNRVISHSVDILGLSPSTEYFFRPLSKASPEKYGQELSFTTTDSLEKIVVLGEEGAPKLSVKSTIDKQILKSREKGVECKIIISNDGNLTAYKVNLINILADGFVYNSTNNASKTWNLGDIDPGSFLSVSYAIDVGDIETGEYINRAQVRASNHDLVEDSLVILVEKAKVLSMEYIKSGFSRLEFFGLITFLIIIVLIRIFIKKKIK